MVFQYYQRGALAGEWKDASSGQAYNIAAPAGIEESIATELKIWVPGGSRPAHEGWWLTIVP